jgi:hypothetical protein
MALFQLMEDAKADRFKEISKLVQVGRLRQPAAEAFAAEAALHQQWRWCLQHSQQLWQHILICTTSACSLC